jgi:hypothetical protein
VRGASIPETRHDDLVVKNAVDQDRGGAECPCQLYDD